MSLKFHEMTIDSYLSALGSTAPAPGGGAAAGLIGTQACAPMSPAAAPPPGAGAVEPRADR